MHAQAHQRQWITHHHIAGAATILSGCAIFFAVIGIGYASLNSDTFYRNTVLANIDIGRMTRDEARQKLHNEITRYEKEFRLHDNHTSFHPSFLELGITIDEEASLEQAWQIGRDGPLVSRLRDTTNSVLSVNSIPLVLEVDEDRMYATFMRMQEKVNVPVENARVRIELPTVEIVPAREGRRLDVLKLEEKFLTSVSALEPETIPLPFIVTQPTIRDEDVSAAAASVSIAVSEPLIVTHNDDAFQVLPDVIATWLDFSEIEHSLYSERKTLAVDLRESALLEYLELLALTIEEPGVARKVIPAVEREEYEAGSIAHLLAREKNSEAIRSATFSSANRTFELITEDAIPDDEILAIPEPPQKDGKAISVDINKQIAYAWLDGELHYFAKVSSGKGGHKTPTGNFKVYGKTRDQKMSGADFYLPHIPFILWYNGDYSFHGTYWHNNFGTPMSHGCSNLSVQDAKWFFEFVDVGTPVVIFES